MSVDFPAPFSPMTECTSPARSTKSTPSSASTPGKWMVMPRMETSGGASMSTGMRHSPWLRECCPARRLAPGGAALVDCGRTDGSVGTRVDDLGRLLLGEALVLHVVGLVDLLVVDHLLDQVRR